MQRRQVLRLAALSAGAIALQNRLHAAPAQQKILDTHIHLFDPTRPGGVIWPEKTDSAIYKPALPDRYKAMAAPFGVVGAIAIEASPLNTDNQWLLDVVRKNPVMVGAIGNLVPGSANYSADLDRLHADPLFLGFRYGNLWDRNLSIDLAKPGFVDGLKALAQAGLVLDSANPDPKLIRALLEVSDRVPRLRIVIDHLPHSPVPAEPAARKEYDSNLARLAANPNVFVKLSEIPVVENAKLVTDPQRYKAALDAIWDLFGEDRILFGSDWPNSDHVAPFSDTLSIVRSYISTKSAAAQDKYFFSNSIAAYRWRPRTPDQHVHSTATGS
jgi:L-fuconolactonase